MLIFPDHGLTYLANPKSGTTAIHMALQRHADIVFKGEKKHMNARRFKTHVAPLLKKAYKIETETVAVMRDPVDRMRSWYKYRTRPELAGTARSTAGMTFDDFVMAALSDAPPENAKVGSQLPFLTDRDHQVLVDHLFDYDNQDALLAFLSAKLGRRLSVSQHNVSPAIDAPISAEVLAAFRQSRSREFALYEGLKSLNGYLRRG